MTIPEILEDSCQTDGDRNHCRDEDCRNQEIGESKQSVELVRTVDKRAKRHPYIKVRRSQHKVAHECKNLPTFCSSTAINSGCMNPYLSGMSRHTTLLPFSTELNRFDNLTLCARSITKIISAHTICSSDTTVIASGARPAESASTPGHPENTSSAVGLRSRFRLQTNSARVNFNHLNGTPSRRRLESAHCRRSSGSCRLTVHRRTPRLAVSRARCGPGRVFAQAGFEAAAVTAVKLPRRAPYDPTH